MPVIDNAVYVDGHRRAVPESLEETFETTRAVSGMAWIGLYRPTHDEIAAVSDEFGLHKLAVEDAIKTHQRPKLERYDDTTFVVLRPARYLDDAEKVEFGEVHVFVGPGFAVTLRHAEAPDLALVRARLEQAPDLLRFGPPAVLYAVFDQVVDEYAPVVAGLRNDIDEIEDQLFDGVPRVTRRIYDLLREVIAFQRATQPLVGMLEALQQGGAGLPVDVELQRHLRDVLDHAIRYSEQADSFRTLLENALTVHTALVAQTQNEQVKKLSSWAAILFAPTIVGSVYGMNFRFMPELDQPWGYPFALLLMLATGATLYGIFKHRHWL